MNGVYENRIQHLREYITAPEQAILLTNEVNIGYFCGFFHSEGVLLVTRGSATLFVDFRYFEAAGKKSGGVEVVQFSKLSESLLEKLVSENIKSICCEAGYISVARFNFFKSAFLIKNIECEAKTTLDAHISGIRIIKDAVEVDKIQTAQNIAEKAYLEMLNHVKTGAKERDLSAYLEYKMKLYGAEDISFDLITITGKKTSLPHGVPDDTTIAEGDFFTCDFGAMYEGYHSDTTRTVAVGYVSDKMREIYEIVMNAQLSALDFVKAGVKSSAVDAVARNIIANAGYGKYFGHATGHGVGVDIHEDPAVSPRCDTVLRAGMVITDEPGIYLPNQFGVRIEDMLLVTEDGYKNFVNLPKQLIIL